MPNEDEETLPPLSTEAQQEPYMEEESHEIPIEEDENIASNDITNNGNGNTFAQGSNFGANVTNNINIKNEEDILLACESCGTPLDSNRYGKIICSGCGRETRRINPFVIMADYDTIEGEEEKKYKKILSHINNKIKDKNYDEAYNNCLKAEDIAPGESTTWEYFALVLYHKERAEKKNTIDILRNIRIQLEKCEFYEIKDTRYDEITKFISKGLFMLEKSRLNSKQPTKENLDGYKIWHKQLLLQCFDHLYCMENCYNLFNDPLYLEEIVKELSKPYKWLIKDTEGKIRKMPSCKDLPILEKRNYLIKELKKHKPEYEPPEIETERFTILGEEDIDPNEIIIISII
jgi:uncharacterized Zn finger protein (UPF0148 family)